MVEFRASVQDLILAYDVSLYGYKKLKWPQFFNSWLLCISLLVIYLYNFYRFIVDKLVFPYKLKSWHVLSSYAVFIGI